MLTGILWLDVMDASAEIDGAEKRGAAPGLVANLRETLKQAEADGDDDSVWAVSQYAARLTGAGAYTETTPADVVVDAGLNAAETVKTAAAGTETLLVLGLLVVAALALRDG